MVNLALTIAPNISGSILVMTNPRYAGSVIKTVENAQRKFLFSQDLVKVKSAAANKTIGFVDFCHILDPGFDKSRLCLKVPATWEGLQACRKLTGRGIKTAATTLFTKEQAILAAEAGCECIIPFIHELKVLFDKKYVYNLPFMPFTHLPQAHFTKLLHALSIIYLHIVFIFYLHVSPSSTHPSYTPTPVKSTLKHPPSFHGAPPIFNLCLHAQQYFAHHAYPTHVKAAALLTVDDAIRLSGITAVTLEPHLLEALAAAHEPEAALAQRSIFSSSVNDKSNGDGWEEKVSYIDNEAGFRAAMRRGHGDRQTVQVSFYLIFRFHPTILPLRLLYNRLDVTWH